MPRLVGYENIAKLEEELMLEADKRERYAQGKPQYWSDELKT